MRSSSSPARSLSSARSAKGEEAVSIDPYMQPDEMDVPTSKLQQDEEEAAMSGSPDEHVEKLRKKNIKQAEMMIATSREAGLDVEFKNGRIPSRNATTKSRSTSR